MNARAVWLSCRSSLAARGLPGRIFVPFLSLALAITVASCGHHRAFQPPDVAQRFASALAARNWDAAYLFMSARYRQQVPLVRFRAAMQAEAALVAADAATFSRAMRTGPAGARGQPSTRAQIDQLAVAGDAMVATPVVLELEGGAWKLSANPVDPFSQASPRGALRTFVRALELRRYDVMLRLVPSRRLAGVTVQSLRAYWEGPGSQEQRRLIELLRFNLDGRIVDLGQEAYLPATPVSPSAPPPVGAAASERTSDVEVRFVLEDGLWKIEDVR